MSRRKILAGMNRGQHPVENSSDPKIPMLHFWSAASHRLEYPGNFLIGVLRFNSISTSCLVLNSWEYFPPAHAWWAPWRAPRWGP